MSGTLLSLPHDVLLTIFDHLSYEEVSQCRLVCRKIDQICQKKLNIGFAKAIRKHALSLRRIKSMLPRRESVRRNHRLSRHADILTSMETRISMLSMTYGRYIEGKMCCFIPGRLLDELYRILNLVSQTHIMLRPHDVLRELRDLSSMAMEHFDERVAVDLKSFSEQSRSVASHSNEFDMVRFLDTNECEGGSYIAPRHIKNTVVSIEGGVPSDGDDGEDGEATKEGVEHQLWNVLFSSTVSVPNACQISRCCHTLRQQINDALQTGQDGLLEGINRHITGNVNFVDENRTVENANGHCGPDLETCPVIKKLGRVTAMHRNGLRQIRRLHRDQKSLLRDFKMGQRTIKRMRSEFGDIRKRIEDVEAKNRELTARINHMSSDETRASGRSAIIPETADCGNASGAHVKELFVKLIDPGMPQVANAAAARKTRQSKRALPKNDAADGLSTKKKKVGQ